MQVGNHPFSHRIFWSPFLSIRFRDEDSAEKASQALQGRFYGGFRSFCIMNIFRFSSFSLGRPLLVEYSPVTDFREARCRQFDMGECNRGGFCNFMHMKKIGKYDEVFDFNFFSHFLLLQGAC